jgi:serine/threonine-protein kinase
MSDVQAPTTIGNYRILRVLGEGGMGVVYEAEHMAMRRRAAIKVLRPELAKDEQAMHRFFNEARATNEVRHPGMVQVYDCGRLEDGAPWLIMELLEGETLTRRLTRLSRLSSAEVIEIGGQAASVLEAAHGAGIVHRDLKPDNLFVIPDPENDAAERVKVLDFGIAKLSRMSSTGSMRTQTGTLMGTPLYMSPEQCRGTKQIDARSDIYSLGLILYQLAAGELPFVSEGIGELFDMQMNRPAPPLVQKVPTVNPALAQAIHRTLEKNPADRFQSMDELGQALVAAGDPAVGRSMTQAMSTTGGRLGRTNPPSQTMQLPTNISTTLTASALEMETERIPPRRSFPVVAVVIAGAVVIGGAIFALRALSPPPSPPPPIAAGTHETEKAVVPPTPPAPPTTPVEATITLDIKTTPSEARVLDAADGRVIGTTPLEQPLARQEGDLTLRIEKDGYLSQTVVVPRSRDFHGAFKLDRPGGGAHESNETHETHESHGSHGSHGGHEDHSTEHIIKL